MRQMLNMKKYGEAKYYMEQLCFIFLACYTTTFSGYDILFAAVFTFICLYKIPKNRDHGWLSL